MRTIEKLRRALPTQFLTDSSVAAVLPDCGRSARIKRLVAQGELIRLKNGFFVFGNDYRTAPMELFTIANLLYGPSYVSLESGLSYHGLIPEHSRTVLNINTKRGKRFTTTVGSFVYRVIKQEAFAVGVSSMTSGSSHFLIASPEKAILDKLYLDSPKGDFLNFLVESMRIEYSALCALDTKKLTLYAAAYENLNLEREVAQLTAQLKDGRHGQ